MTNRMIRSAGWLAASCVLVAMTAAPVQAQNRVRVHIPFGFQAGAESMSAGVYVIEGSGLPGRGVMRVHNLDLNKTIALMTLPAIRPMAGDYPRLKFEVLAGAYRLSEIWTPGSEGGAMVPRTKEQAWFAKNGGKVKTIALALTTER